jgi:hypothetical protein
MFGKCLAYPIKGFYPQLDPSFCDVVPGGGKLALDNGIVENTVVGLATPRLTRSGRRLRIATTIVFSTSFSVVRLAVKRPQRLILNKILQGFNLGGKVPKVLQMETCGRDIVVQFEKELKAAIGIQDVKRFQGVPCLRSWL